LNGWHLKKEVTVGQVVTLMAVIVSGLWWASSVETRIAQLSAEGRRIEQKQDVQNKGIERILGRIESKQDKLIDKIDQKADK